MQYNLTLIFSLPQVARRVSPSWLGGKWLHGDDYLGHVAIPNFFFHATMAYAILRHNGVEIGKRDFLGEIPIRMT